MSIFGVSGIRGLIGSEMTPEITMKAGQSIGMQYRNVVVGRDARPSGEMLTDAFVAGLASVGSDAVCVGIAPMPTIARCIKKDGCGVMITASNNSAEYNGMRFINYGGASFSEAQIKILKTYMDNPSRLTLSKSMKVGKRRETKPPIQEHKRDILGTFQSIDCPVIVDCASDSTSLITPSLLADLGADVITINSNIDGRFSGRHPEPNEANLSDLIRQVKAEPGTIGLAHDGCGSRIAAVDESGRYLNGNVLIALMAMYLKPNSIAVPINASMVIDEIVPGFIFRTKVGDGFVAESMIKNSITLGGEPSGTFIFGQKTLCPDGVCAAAVIASIASEGSLRQTVDSLPNYPMGNIDIKYRGDYEDIARRLDEKISSSEYEALYKYDGWRVELDDGWYYIRMSGTENKVRITAEARDKIYMNCLLEIAEDIVSACIR